MPDEWGRLTAEEFEREARTAARQMALREDLTGEARHEREQERAARAAYDAAPEEEREVLKAEMRRRFDRVTERVLQRRAQIGAHLERAGGDRLYHAARWGDLIFREVIVEWWRRAPARAPGSAA